MFPVYQHSFRAAKLLLGALIFLQACSCAMSSSGETCYSRQHRDTNVNVRKALDHPKTIMEVSKKEAERDCILACCSEELKPGIKCNMVVYKPSGQDDIENCYLFHCETEQDCPLMSAKPGTNTYDIFKGLTHPSTKGKERVTSMPITITKQPTTTQSTSTTTKPTTTTTTIQPTTSTSTTQSSTTTAPTTSTTSTVTPTELAIIFLTIPAEIVPTAASTTPATTTTTTTTQSTTITTKVATTRGTTATPHPVQQPQPQPQPNPIRPSKKQIRPPKKTEPHGKSSAKVVEIPTLQKQDMQQIMIPTSATTTPTTTTTTTTTPTTTTTTTTTPTTTTTTSPTTTTTTTATTTTTQTTTTTTTPTTTTTTTSTTTTERTTVVVVEMENDLKNGNSGPDSPAVASPSDKAKESHLTLKNSLALLVVLTLIILTFVVAVVCRRAMESFDRRHYTRLELNDLHYEI